MIHAPILTCWNFDKSIGNSVCGEGGSFGAEEAEQDAVAMVVFITRQNLKKNCKNIPLGCLEVS